MGSHRESTAEISQLENRLDECVVETDALSREIRAPQTTRERRVEAVKQRDAVIAERKRVEAGLGALRRAADLAV